MAAFIHLADRIIRDPCSVCGSDQHVLDDKRALVWAVLMAVLGLDRPPSKVVRSVFPAARPTSSAAFADNATYEHSDVISSIRPSYKK